MGEKKPCQKKSISYLTGVRGQAGKATSTLYQKWLQVLGFHEH
jgi:hypothetical protein